MAKSERAFLNVARFSEEDETKFRAITTEGSSEDPKALRILRRYPEVAAEAGELSRHIAAGIIARIAGGAESVGAECYRQRCAEMRLLMGYDAAPEVERLLIDRIVVTWLHMNRVETVRQTDGMTLTKAAYYDRAASLAQADHLRALTALARVRRLALPAVQLNMTTGNQLNVAGS